MIKTAKKYNLEITNSSNIKTKYRNLPKLGINTSASIDTMLSELIDIQLQDKALASEKAAEAAKAAKAAAESEAKATDLADGAAEAAKANKDKQRAEAVKIEKQKHKT